jgi:hypothetical protein
VSGNNDGLSLLVLTAVFFIFIILLGASTNETVIITSPGLTVNPASIEWGKLYPGSVVSRVVQVSNVGEADLLLNMTTRDLPGYLVLNWNCTNHNLKSYEVVQAIFTLTVSPNADEGKFKFDCVVQGNNVK